MSVDELTCVACGLIARPGNRYPEGWEMVEGGDLCPHCAARKSGAP